MRPKYILLFAVSLIVAVGTLWQFNTNSPILENQNPSFSNNNNDKPQGIKKALLHLQQIRANQNTGTIDARDVLAARRASQ